VPLQRFVLSVSKISAFVMTMTVYLVSYFKDIPFYVFFLFILTQALSLLLNKMNVWRNESVFITAVCC